MTSTHDKAETVLGAAREFATTRWSVVMAAGSASPRSGEALAQLCQAYWYPLYAYVRRQGHNAHDAQDLTQEFFARLLEKNYLSAVNRDKGRFRSFLLASLKHFLANEWDKARAQKRGGGKEIIHLDAHDAETRYSLEPRDVISADKIYERRWAMLLLDRVLLRLQEEQIAAGKGKQFESLKVCLLGDRASVPYTELATQMGMTESNVKVTVHRLRQRYRELLRAEIAETVDSPAEVEEELRHLFTALS
ncbi:MAG TPA: sigma-70 family RNA polymerase sigma factor [Verrucomicrobiae bacterium]